MSRICLLLEAICKSASIIFYVKYNLKSFGRDPPSRAPQKLFTKHDIVVAP